MLNIGKKPKTLKTLQIIPALPKGGAERLVLNICHELTKREAIELTLITFREDNAYPFLTTGINYKVIQAKFVPSLSGKPLKQLDALQEFINSYQPDIIHSHLFEAEMVSRQVLYPTATYFTHFHDNMHQLRPFSWQVLTNKTYLTEFYEKYLLQKQYKQCNNHCIAISQDAYQYAQKALKLTSKDVTLLHNAIDLSRFKPSNESKTKLRLVSIGSLVPKKAHAFLVDVVVHLHQIGIKAELDILGDGPEKDAISNRIKEVGLTQSIRLQGNVPYPEEFLQKADVYIHSANYEPFGLVLIEAMACGLPVVCTDGKGNRDLIKEGENGFMVWERDPKQFAEKVSLLLKEKDLYASMSKNALAFSQQFGIKEYVDKLLELYKKQSS
ncbi:glycosyltransferase [Flammeovirgaceae bacterium SG7u.111]|nr:glycosyltransferase [Flammeovirgaceae bacterium SG7u.132]WPO34981.1 glycosyltransferase [Flammeovirgaceae bacterium SG7u.111]